ncbi:hypothetical protein COUCH_11730 [Couchioplanes caeruleus]|uniref:hypothetical protein n=1 Tax=Couchioplanes caeruleus TaxID=56438 RepID=UPI0020BF4E42|nr:hypothetical protein [Couchioplanes caeruleus]UQU66891.1 hypothetical protein COUCH_11730 [Couchioplanes caeruleus]
MRSAAFIDEVHSVVAEQARATPSELALRLDVALPESMPLLAFHDLDNYLFPLVPRVVRRIGRPFASVWATKRHAARSTVAVAEARRVDDPGGPYAFEVRTTVSAGTTAYKEQIRDQVAAQRPLPDGGVALQLAFVVGPRRNWANLWKPTIDSLGSLLGRDPGAREWNVRDGRIVDLGLHCVVDAAVGHDVVIAVRGAAAG